MASRRGLFDDQWGTPVSLARGRSREACAGHPGATAARQARREEVLSPAVERVDVRPAGHHHGSAQKLWCGEAGHAPRCGTSSALLSQPPCGAFTPTDPPAGAAHAGVYITGARATRPRRVWSDGPTCQTETPPAPCPRVSPRNGSNDAKAGGSSRAWSSPPKSRPRCTPPTSLAAGGIGTHTWPTPDNMHRHRALEAGER
jgi:hypothetical protein